MTTIDLHEHWPPATHPGEGWRDNAACIGTPLTVFYGDHPTTALSLCSNCPVADQCIAAAFFEERHAAHIDGVRGGTTPTMRRRWFAGQSLPTKRPRVAVCGTDSGYSRHRRDGEDPCAPCKQAHSRAETTRRARHRLGLAPARAADARSRRMA